MGSPILRYTCKRCGTEVDNLLDLSKARLCDKCQLEAISAATEAMVTHSGPLFVKWRRNVAASVGAILPDTEGQQG